MAVEIKIKRGTRAQLLAAASGGNLNAGELYLITDEGRIAVGLSASSFEEFSKVSEASSAPPGQIAFFAQSSAPSGWLKANGAAVSRTAYAALFAAIGTTHGAGDGSTTFNVPDLRGEFIRGWDNGRGVDSGRALGTAQLDAGQRLQGSINPIGAARASGTSTSGVFSQTTSSGQSDGALFGGNAEPIIIFDSALVARTASETRSRNVALLASIKY